MLWLDTETRCDIPIKRGLRKYATNVEVTVISWAVDDDEPTVEDTWGAIDGPSPALLKAARECDKVKAHNAQFDETVLEADPNMAELAAALRGKWECTMVQAYRHGLPGGLDKLCTIFKIPEDAAKHKRGRELIMLFCKPMHDGTWATPYNFPKEWAEFLAYAGSDITAMRACYKKMPKWNQTAFEERVWQVDQAINRRGIAVDLILAHEAVRACAAEMRRIKKRTVELTGGADKEDDAFVQSPTQRDKLLQFMFIDHGVQLPDLKQDTVERRLDDPELAEEVKELLRLRISGARSSVSKYKKILDIHVDGRLYQLLQYGAAYRTLRWGGRTFQPQNLKRPKLSFEDILAAIEAVKSGSEHILIDDVMGAMSDAVRSVLVAGPGKKLIVSDLSNIEGRTLPWLAGEEWKVQAFRDYDAGIGEDLYCVIYGQTFDMDPADVDKEQRQVGKVLELAFAIQGGAGAVATAAATYRFDLAELAQKAVIAMPRQIYLDAKETYRWALKKRLTKGMPEDIWVACEGLKVMWRNAHPGTSSFWAQLEAAARTAIWNPGHTVKVGEHIEFDMKGVWLRMRLPSGRYLCYPNATADGERGAISYAAWNTYTKGWWKQSTYGGKFASDARQALAREFLAYAMVDAEDEGYPLVLTVHDELVAETPDSPEFTAAGLSGMLTRARSWAPGIPLAAAGHEMHRYRKL